MNRRSYPATDDVPPSPRQGNRPIIAIGTSLASLPALQRFLLAVEPDYGATFVIVPHLEPGQELNFGRIASLSCSLDLVKIDRDVDCVNNRVYIVPPDASVTIDAGRLHLSAFEGAADTGSPIDRFFISLAEDQEENAGCVILAGTQIDGALGVRAIKAYGGIAFAPHDTDSRPSNSNLQPVAFADAITSVEELPLRIRAHFAHLHALVETNDLGKMRDDIAACFPDFCDILRIRTGYDFSGHKSSIAVQRIQRRMHVLQIADCATFLARLKAHPQEADLLFQDLLVSVTRFFSDKETLAALEHDIIPQIADTKRAGDTLRVWVPGCATGEEAFAVAMLLCETIPDEKGVQIQIFAGDLDERALRMARQARYPLSIAESLTPERLERFFTLQDGSYCVADTLRSKCLLAKHDLLSDPPFSRVDLVICRNVLVEMEPRLQNRIVPLLHYALREGGFLLMGESENVSDTALFEPVEHAHRIFRKRTTPGRRIDFPISRHVPPRHSFAVGEPSPPPSMQAMAEQNVLDRYAPAHVIMNADGEIFYASGRTGPYFEMAAGVPVNNAFELARPGLREELRAAFQNAAAQHQPVIMRDLTLEANGEHRKIDLIVQPLDQIDSPDATYMLVFRDIGSICALEVHEAERREHPDYNYTRQLERDLRLARERLQTTSEELETSNEELRSANEELFSLNEELTSVNSELSVRVDELGAALSDVSNLLESTQIATIFLDRRFRLRFFTPAAADFYHVVANDLGRPIFELRPRFDASGLQSDAYTVMSSLKTAERRISSLDDRSQHDMRILPYKTSEGAIEGVVITFVPAK